MQPTGGANGYLRTLIIHSDDNGGRHSEIGFIVAYLRRCVAAIGSQQLGIKGLRNAELLDELAEQAHTFLSQFTSQVKTICRLTGRRSANYIDVMNALHFLDGEVYQDMLKLSSDKSISVVRRAPRQAVAAVGLEDDTRAMSVYLSYRLNRPLQCPMVTWRQMEEGNEFIQLPNSINMPASYIEQSIKTVIDTSKATERVLRGGASATPLPSINYDTWVTHPSVFCRVYPPGKTAANVGGRTKRSTVGDDTMQLNLAPPITQLPNKYNLQIGVLQRPARLANEQLAFTERSDLLKPAKVPPVPINLTTDGDSTTEPPPLIPSRPPRSATLIPTHICPWYPLIPPLSAAYPRDDSGIIPGSLSTTDTGPTRDNTAAEDDRTALHLELCSIQPDHPPIIKSELSRNSKLRRTETG